jgi:hypothetical protein
MSERTVFRAISAVQKALSEAGIAKNQRNEFDNYQFRGIDEVLNTWLRSLPSMGC